MKRAVLILGAGAAKAWDALLTHELTNLVLADKSFLTKEGVPLAQFVFDKLKEFHNGNNLGINFETIINSLESIHDYYINKSVIGGGPNFVRSFSKWFDANALVDEIMNFKFISEGLNDGMGSVKNLAGNTYNNVHISRSEARYIGEAIKHYLNLIRRNISHYSISANDIKNKELNFQLKKFILYLLQNNYVLRIYTTNYDRLYPIIFSQQVDIEFFDGFVSSASKGTDGKYYAADIPRILNDFSCVSYYCLHGSIYWDYNIGNNETEYQFFCTPNQTHDFEIYNNAQFTNPGENTFISNIVTGYNKLQRISLEPLSSFHSVFGQDCINSQLIVTVGYSFSDFHINRRIANAFKFNDPKLLHITYGGNAYPAVPEFNRLKRNILRTKSAFRNDTYVEKDWLKSEYGKQMIYCSGYKNFLESQEFLNSNI